MSLRTIYLKAQRLELQVGEFLARRGLRWERAVGSRGPADLFATDGRRRKYVIKVRSGSRALTGSDLDELLVTARRIHAKAALATIVGTHVEVRTVPKGSPLYAGKLRPTRANLRKADCGSNVSRFWWISRRRARELLLQEQLTAEVRQGLLPDVSTAVDYQHES